MTLLQPLFLLVCVFAAAPLIPRGLAGVALDAKLPAGWQRLVSTDMRQIANRHVIATRDRTGSILRALLWLTLGLALAEPAFENDTIAPASNIGGRVIIVDLSNAEQAAAVRGAAAVLSASAPGVPVALVAATGDAFDIVPFTTDVKHVTRYLSVLDPELMPVAGHEPRRAIAHAEAMLIRAGMIAGQTVLVTATKAAPARQLARDRWLRAIVYVLPDSSFPAPLVALAKETEATLAFAADLSAVDRELEAAISNLIDGSPDQSGRMPLQPWLAGMAALLWLLQFRRPT